MINENKIKPTFKQDKVRIKYPLTYVMERKVREKVLEKFGLDLDHNQFFLLTTVHALEYFIEGEQKIPLYLILGVIADLEGMEDEKYGGWHVGRMLHTLKDLNLLEHEVKVTMGRNYSHWKCTPMGNTLIGAYRDEMWEVNAKVATPKRLKKYHTRERREYLKNKKLKNKYRNMRYKYKG